MFSSSSNSAVTEKQENKRGMFRSRSKVQKDPNEGKAKNDYRDDVCAEDEGAKTAFWKGEKKQKAIVYRQFSDDPKAVLSVETEEGVPAPSSRYHVVVKVQASTVSYNDCLLRRGMCFSVFNPVGLPATPGMDVIGNIVAFGSKVTGWEEGDRIAALIQTGGNARYVQVHQDSLVAVPRSLDSAEAACMVSTYMAAYQSLKLVLGGQRTLEGKKILVTGGIGPTGQALIQMSKRAGAEKVYATAPDKMHRYVKLVLGAKPIPMEPERWLPDLEGQMDVVLDGVCQDGFSSPQKALAPNGTLVCVGMAALLNSESMGAFGAPISAHWTKTKASWFMSKTKFYDVWSSFQNDPKKYKSDLAHVLQLLKKRDIKPHISKRVSLSDVPEAHVYLELGKARGTIVCLPWRRRIPGTGVKAGEYGEDVDERDD